MIVPSSGDLLEADAEALVNAVNCGGVMGKGIALQFKEAFPENYLAYVRACHSRPRWFRPGRMLTCRTWRLTNPSYIINFPTKTKWREKSRLEYIETGLKDLVEVVRDFGLHSIAIPALGCGLGGLSWDQVRPLIVEAFEALPEVKVLLYEPQVDLQP